MHHTESMELQDLFYSGYETARAIGWTLCHFMMVISAVIDPLGGEGAGNSHLLVFRNMART